MSDKKFIIQGEEFDYGEMTDKQLLSVYNQLLDRQKKINEKIGN